MRVALAHDYLTQRGGAERVVLALHRMFPEAPIFTALFDPADTFAGFADADVRPSPLQRLPHRGGAFRALLPLYPRTFDRMVLRDFDLVISSSSGWAHGVRAPGALHICYCHAPAKWLYRTREYGGTTGRARMALAAPLLRRLRRWDARAATRPDVYVANSAEIARQIRRVYDRSASIVHPPVEVERFPAPSGPPDRDAPYLVVARLLPYKRIDLAVRACTARGAPLVVVGEGPALGELRRLAGPTVRFDGRIDEDALTERFLSCRALLQPGQEDFGIVPIEANAAGRPVVAFGAGGARETVVDGRTGVLFPAQTVESLAAALDRLEASSWDPHLMRAHAERFSTAAFERGMRAVIADARAASQEPR